MSALTDLDRDGYKRMTSDLRFCREQFESIRSDVKDFAAGLDATQLRWQPDASSWSIGQCLEHLNSSAAYDLERLRTLSLLGRAAVRPMLRRPTAGPVVPLLSLIESPRYALSTTIALRESAPDCDAATVVTRFLSLNRSLLDAIDSATDIARRASASDTLGALLDLSSHILQLNALHHWRFILQARRVMERPGFPRR